MLAACHERIEAMLRILERLPAHLAGQGADSEACSAAQRVLRYFDEAGPRHHADEETDLFPMLAAQGLCAELLPALRNQHRDMEETYGRLRPALVELAAGRVEAWPQDAAARFCALYREHMGIENAQLLPAAEAALSEGQKRALGEAMAARRKS
jgi:hemerythrin-like domain-containing protein